MLSKGKKHQAGLAKALTRLGMAFVGRKHRADDDALNTFLIAHKLLQEMKSCA
jgi:inhibitor of KinA sporulation pathway (predicted exonuclease)